MNATGSSTSAVAPTSTTTGQEMSTPLPVAPPNGAQCEDGESHCMDTTTANSCTEGSWETADCTALCREWGIDSGVCDSSSGSCTCDGDFLDRDCAVGTLAMCECVTGGCTDHEFANVYLNCFHDVEDARTSITCLGAYAALDENDELVVNCDLAATSCLQDSRVEQ